MEKRDMDGMLGREMYREEVDLVINTFERTYREVFKTGFVDEISNESCFSFTRKIIIINNVENKQDATKVAEIAKERGEITDFCFVSDNINHALQSVGLHLTDLGRVPFYSDWALVAVALSGSRWFVHWDAEVRMSKKADWISPSIEIMSRREDIFTCNPSWTKGNVKNSGAAEAVQVEGEFYIGYGFSDQLFLGDRKRMAQKIYKYFSCASLRYPLSHICSPFEQRIDAYMRSKKLKRATYSLASYTHPEDEGFAYPAIVFSEKVRLFFNLNVTRLLRRSRSSNPKWKI